MPTCFFDIFRQIIAAKIRGYVLIMLHKSLSKYLKATNSVKYRQSSLFPLYFFTFLRKMLYALNISKETFVYIQRYCHLRYCYTNWQVINIYKNL